MAKYKLADKGRTQFAFAPTDNPPAKVGLKPIVKKASPAASKKLTEHYAHKWLDEYENPDHSDNETLVKSVICHDHRPIKRMLDQQDYDRKFSDFRGMNKGYEEFKKAHPHLNHKEFGDE